MKLNKIFLFYIISLTLISSGTLATFVLLNTPEKHLDIKEIEPFVDVNSTNEAELTYEQKRGVLSMVSIPDKELSEDTTSFLKEKHIKGVILMGNNIENDEQLRKLTKDLREKVDPNLLISIDQEGGLVARIDWEPHASVSAREIGERNDLDYAYKVAFERGQFLKERGINVVLGPVADIAYTSDSFMYERSFGSDPAKVSEFVKMTVEGHKDAGVMSVLKHFPGHGNTVTDSHNEFATINTDLENLRNTDFKPFEAGLEAGAEMIMVGHIINMEVDPDLPATISEKFLRFLEDEMEGDFIIMTDDLKMTGKIEGGAGWAINIMIEDREQIEKRIDKINPQDKYVKKVLELTNSPH